MLVILLIFVIIIVVLSYRYSTRNHDYWAKRNVKHDKPLPFFENHLPNLLQRRNQPNISVELYNKFEGEKMVGYYRGTHPELIIRDPDIIKRIYNTDFDYFPARGHLGSREKDPLLHNVIFIAGDEWRKTRQKLSPGFSPGKLKAMFPLLVKCTEQLQETLKQISETQEEVNTYDLMSRFPLQFVGSCGFGVELNTLNKDYSKFVELAKSFFIKTKLQIFFVVLSELLPAHWFNPKIVKQELEDAIYSLCRQIREERNFKPSGRNDFMDIILKMEIETQPESKDNVEMNIDFIAAQMFSLLLGGFETSATSIAYTLHQLAFHPKIQEEIQREIDEVMSRHGEKLTYEGIGEMSHLEMAWKESMRLFSPFGGVNRVCVKKYKIPGTEVIIDPGIKIILPCQAMNMDPEYFEDPQTFRPERFGPKAESKISNVYNVFGDGPRKCLGLRLAYMIALSALATVLHRYTVAIGPSTCYKPRHRNSILQAQNVEGGLPLRLIPRNNKK